MWIFCWGQVGAPNPHVVQVLTVLVKKFELYDPKVV